MKKNLFYAKKNQIILKKPKFDAKKNSSINFY